MALCRGFELSEDSLQLVGISFYGFYLTRTLDDFWHSTKFVQHRFNLTKTVRKIPIDPRLQRIGHEVHSGPVPIQKRHGDAESDEDIFEHLGEGAVELTRNTFDLYAHQ